MSQVPSTEHTPLVSSPPPPPAPALEEVSSNDDGASSAARTNSSEVGSDDELWQELEQPWPSTFERSISLLASPQIHYQQAKQFTKSPQPGSSQIALRKRSNLNRGYYTPDTGVVSPYIGRLARKYHDRGEEDEETNNNMQDNLITRVQSLDFAKIPALRNMEKQESKAQAAQEYRAKILQLQQQKLQDDQEHHKFSNNKKSRRMTKRASTTTTTDKPEKSSLATVSQSAFNLANILMGVGLLGLPFVFKSAGWYGGIGAVIAFGVVTWRTSILIGRELNGDPRPSSSSAFVVVNNNNNNKTTASSTISGTHHRLLEPMRSFPDIARASFGDTGCLILSVILYFELFSCLCIFFVAMGDHLHQLFPSVSVTTCQGLVASLSTIPTILLHTPRLLSYLSMMGTFATVTLVCSVIAAALVEGDISHEVAEHQGMKVDDDQTTHTLFRPEGMTLALGLVAYCFSGHAIVPSIYTSMAQPEHFERMVTTTFIVVIVCCLLVAVSGYIMFGDLVENQVTLSLEENSSAVYAMKALTWLMILTAFSKVTLTMFPLAIGIEEIVAPFLTTQSKVRLASAVIKLTLTALALGVSMFFPNFSYLCALVGMICTMSVSVIFPAAAHLRMFAGHLSVWEQATDWLLVVLGTIMAVVGTAATL